MADKLPKYTWSASTVTLKGGKQAVYSTLTGDLVGYVENGKFRQVAEIPQPKPNAPEQADAPIAITTVSQASDAYNVARFAFQRAESLLNETPRTSANYQTLLKDRNAKKQAVDDSLALYKSISLKKTTTEKETSERNKYNKQLKSNAARIKSLQDDLSRAKDKGQDTSSIEAAIRKLEEESDTAREGLAEVGKDNRPTGVPKEAKFNTVTGNWESGTQKWDTSGQAVTAITTKEVKGPKGGTVTKGTMPEFPTGGPTGPGTTSGSRFNPAAAVAGDQASMGVAKPVMPTTPTATPFEKIMAEAVKLYGGIDEIFASNEELKNLLIRSIGDPTTAKDDMDEDQFINLLQNTTWYKTNSGPIRQRGFEKRQYDALVKKLKTDDPQYKAKIEELNRTSTYGRGIQDVVELLRENATKLGRQISDDDLRVIAAGIYDYANEDDAVKIRNAILGAGTFGAGKGIVGGAAGQNLTTLRAVARANGFDLDTVFKDSVDTWLDKIAKGESIETFKSVIRNTAKAGLPDRVASLLDQGVDLETIYSPYKRIMAATLEVSPESITLNDPTLRMGIGPDKEVSLYEYQRMLRKDPRWQYTNNAREDVSNSVLTVARNFGFQG
jgi:hypothetical protein